MVDRHVVTSPRRYGYAFEKKLVECKDLKRLFAASFANLYSFNNVKVCLLKSIFFVTRQELFRLKEEDRSPITQLCLSYPRGSNHINAIFAFYLKALRPAIPFDGLPLLPLASDQSLMERAQHAATSISRFWLQAPASGWRDRGRRTQYQQILSCANRWHYWKWVSDCRKTRIWPWIYGLAG